MSASIKTVKRGITERLNQMTERAGATQGFFLKVVYPRYQKSMLKKWAEEGPGWARLDAAYAARKAKKYAGYPGAGRKMLIVTDRLRQSVIGPVHSEFKMAVTRSSLVIRTDVPYSSYVNEKRNFATIDASDLAQWKSDLMDYVTGRSR